jgi:hypothetical protein
MNQVSNAETSGSTYKGLYRLGGVAAIIVVVLTVGEVIGFAFYPQPATASEWFKLFQRNRIIGLVDFWGLEVPMYGMFILVFLALYAALRKTNDGLMAIALILALLGAGIFFATNNPFSMLALSDRYAAATTETHRSAILAAGQAVLANTNQRAVGGFNIALFLVSVAGLIVSSIMLQDDSFSRRTAYVGILAHGLSLADYVRQALTSSVVIALLVILPGALCVAVWFTLVGRRLAQLGRSGGNT